MEESYINLHTVNNNYIVFGIAGRYMKYSRQLSQSPWVVDGHRKTESSVEELICEYTKAKLNAEGKDRLTLPEVDWVLSRRTHM